MEPLLFLLIVVLPGFICIAIIRELILPEEDLNQFELTIWSGFVSVIIYLFVFSVFNIPLNAFEKNIELTSKSLLSKIALFSFGFAIYLGLLFSYLIVRYGNYFTGLRDSIHGKRLEKDRVWDIIMDGFDGGVIIHTSDGSRYYGRPTRFSKSKERKELLLCEPHKRNKKREYKKLGNTKALLFLENDIKRIEFIPYEDSQELCPKEEKRDIKT